MQSTARIGSFGTSWVATLHVVPLSVDFKIIPSPTATQIRCRRHDTAVSDLAEAGNRAVLHVRPPSVEVATLPRPLGALPTPMHTVALGQVIPLN